jgi:hypothetical protein
MKKRLFESQFSVESNVLYFLLFEVNDPGKELELKEELEDESLCLS